MRLGPKSWWKRPKRPKTHPTFEAIHKKLKSKAMHFFVQIYKIFRMFRGFEQISSAICWRVMTCSTCANLNTCWLLIDLCPPFLHYALSEENRCCKPIWRSNKFRLWRESYVRKRFPMNKEGTWMQKVYNSIMCVLNKANNFTDVYCGMNLTYANVFQWTRNALECKRSTIP